MSKRYVGKKMTVEEALLIKTTPKFGSKRYEILSSALGRSNQRHSLPYCERCKKMLFNPRSILLHQGGFCQKQYTGQQIKSLEA